MHWAPRAIVGDGIMSVPVVVGRSILAGSGSSNDVARAYLHKLLHDLHYAIPRCKLGSRVDDIHVQL
eukprot:7520320-Lingulodinium_polyedra.AAC.1